MKKKKPKKKKSIETALLDNTQKAKSETVRFWFERVSPYSALAVFGFFSITAIYKLIGWQLNQGPLFLVSFFAANTLLVAGVASVVFLELRRSTRDLSSSSTDRTNLEIDTSLAELIEGAAQAKL